MSLDCKLYCKHCVICNRDRPDRRGGASLQPLGIPDEYPCGIVGIDYVTDLPKSGFFGHTTILIMVCHLTKMLGSFCSMPQGNHCKRVNRLISKLLFKITMSPIEILSLLEISGKFSCEN